MQAGSMKSDDLGTGGGCDAISDRAMKLYMEKAQGSSFPKMR
jgi:hypothetical protein